MMASVGELVPWVGVSAACQAVAVGRASFYRHQRHQDRALAQEDLLAPRVTLPAIAEAAASPAEVARANAGSDPLAAVSPTPARVHPRALSTAEQQAVLDLLHSPRFRDAAPAAVYTTLLDEGVYLASERTMYRLLLSGLQF